ncbi:MAG: MFS transporter [Lachnospiraceae bacterium]|nr:MFS transporter [Lachnospiraceae bacterium]
MNDQLKRRLKRNIKLDYVSTFVVNLNMQGAIWVLYLIYCGMSLAQVGVLEGIYHATSILCEIPSGAAADLLGRKHSMIISRICILISCLIMLFFKSFWLFALSFVIQAIGNNFNSGSEEALVYDSMKYVGEEEKYRHVYGRLNFIIEIAGALSTVMGGVLTEYSYVWSYAACTGIAAAALLPVLFMEEVPRVQEAAHTASESVCQLVRQHFVTSWHILKSDIRIFKIILYYSVIDAAYMVFSFYGQQYYAEFGYNKIEISIIFLAASGAACLGAVLSERLYEKLRGRLTTLASILIGAALVSYRLENTVLSILFFMVASFFNTTLYPVQSEALNRLIPSEQRATLISVDSMFFSIAMIVIFPLAGLLADGAGLSSIFLGIGVLLWIFVSVWRKR